MMRRLQLLIAFFIAAYALQAQAPSGYYDDAEGKTGTALKAALHDIIKDHDEISYQQIWNAFQYTDLKSNGKIWDMYSDNPNGNPPYEFTYSSDQCGGYEGEGDCYNREHSWPKNWFNDDENSTPGHDLHHIFPTDGYVNAQRSNYPYGEVSNATWTSQNGSKLGNCKSSLGYTGKVFEPIDEYKGDFARAIMYMSVRYYTEDDNWSTSGMTEKSEIKPWAIDMLLDWHRNDQPDAKEIARNNKIYNSYQHNRNPFIDNPDYAELIWNPNYTSSCEIAVASNIEGAGDVSMVVAYNANPSIDFTAQGYADGTTISSATIDNNVSVAFNKGTNSSNAPKYYTSGTAIRCYGGNYFTVSTANGAISKIVLTFGSSDGSNTITTNVGSYSNGTWTGDASSVKFTIGGSSGNRRLAGIAVTYSYQSSPIQQTICPYGATATLTATPSTHYDFVNWTKNGSVISTDATYSVQVSENATYQANFTPKSYTISVAASSSAGGMAYIGDAPEPSHTYTASKDFSQQGYSDGQEVSSATIDNNVLVAFNKGTSQNVPKYYNTGTAIRCYGGNYFTVSTTDGSITKIVLAFGSGDGSNAITTNVGSFSSSTWTGSATSVKFTIGGTSGHRRVKKITVTYTTGGGSYVTQTTLAYGSSTTITAVPNSGYSFVNWTTNSSNYSADATCDITVGGDANYIANFTTNSVAANTSVTLPALTLAENVAFTVNSGATLTVTGGITQASGSAIEIANGGQLICNNSVYVKMQKSITAWNASTGAGWYAIASPVYNQAFADVVNLVNTANNPLHNIYRYDEAETEWEEYRDEHNIFTSFENGRGYLFRTEDSHGMIEFKGNNNVDDIEYGLSYACTDENYKGFNLIGNPFTQNITWADLTKTNVDSEGYYLLEETGTEQGKWTVVKSSSAAIAPMRAFLVQATGNNPSVTFSRVAKKEETRNEAAGITFNVSNSQYSDESYVMFKEGYGLNKIEHRNAEIPMLYVIDNDEHYAIADVDENVNVIDLGFEAMTMGQYTLSLKTSGDFSYLHLIDKLTGNDVDMLADNEYSFIGAPQDIDSRFVVRLEFSHISNDSENLIFAYQSGDDLIVEGEGTLQIFDITGRMVNTQYVNGVETMSTSSMPTGIYILRLIGDNVKTQKIVVK